MLLTDEEIEALNVRTWDARIIERAVLEKLCAGVDMPEAKKGTTVVLNWQGRGDGTVEALEVNGQMAIPDADGVSYVTSEQAAKFFGFDVAIAAARLKALEDAEKKCEVEADGRGDEDAFMARLCVKAIRALKGEAA